jgi:hypothetical protein
MAGRGMAGHGMAGHGPADGLKAGRRGGVKEGCE